MEDAGEDMTYLYEMQRHPFLRFRQPYTPLIETRNGEMKETVVELELEVVDKWRSRAIPD